MWQKKKERKKQKNPPSVWSSLFKNHIIAILQQDSNLKITTVMIFWFNFQPVIQSGWWIPISSTLSSRSAVIYHLSNKINLFPCPLHWLGVLRETCHISQKTTTQWRRLHLYSCSKSVLPSRCQISACAHFQLKQTAGLVYNISLIILIAWILDNGEQGEKIVS